MFEYRMWLNHIWRRLIVSKIIVTFLQTEERRLFYLIEMRIDFIPSLHSSVKRGYVICSQETRAWRHHPPLYCNYCPDRSVWNKRLKPTWQDKTLRVAADFTTNVLGFPGLGYFCVIPSSSFDETPVLENMRHLSEKAT